MPRALEPVDRLSKSGDGWAWTAEMWLPGAGPDAVRATQPYWSVKLTGRGKANLPASSSWSSPSRLALETTAARAMTHAKTAMNSGLRSVRRRLGSRGTLVVGSARRQHQSGVTTAKRMALMTFPVKNLGVRATVRAARTGSRARR